MSANFSACCSNLGARVYDPPQRPIADMHRQESEPIAIFEQAAARRAAIRGGPAFSIEVFLQ
jgi:hypothetical protein